jgi:hypothetical protein
MSVTSPKWDFRQQVYNKEKNRCTSRVERNDPQVKKEPMDKIIQWVLVPPKETKKIVRKSITIKELLNPE